MCVPSTEAAATATPNAATRTSSNAPSIRSERRRSPFRPSSSRASRGIGRAGRGAPDMIITSAGRPLVCLPRGWSASEQNAQEQGGERADAGEGAEDGQRARPAGARVQGGRDARDEHHDQLHHQRGLVAARDLGPDGDDVPDPGDDQDPERGPGDLVEAARRGARDIGAGPPQDRDQRRQRDLPADPDGGREHVQEQPDGVPCDAEHVPPLVRADARNGHSTSGRRGRKRRFGDDLVGSGAMTQQPAESGAVDPARIRRWQELLASERDAAALYSRLAEAETGERRKIFEELAGVERRHAGHWERKLADAGARVPPPGRPGLRTTVIAAAARRLSARAVLPMVERAERSDAGIYDLDPDAAPGMAEDERGHARTLAKLIGGRPDPREQIARRERWHRGDRSGTLRAGVFGVSDGLVSNTSLVMGFAGSGAARIAIMLAGVAGLLAGSFSMAAGEYVSMASQREMYEREISLEAAEIREKPQEERAELVLLYRAKGLSRADAEHLADRIMADPNIALDTIAREELGLDPSALGSPWLAAASSFLTFALGAFVVVLPYLAGSGTAALLAAIGLAAAALLAVGAGIGALNGRPALSSGARQLLVGGIAAAVTFGVGHLIGGAVS